MKWFLLIVAIIHCTNGQMSNSRKLFTEDMRAFAGKMYYYTISNSNSVNFIYSPLSITQAMGMTLAGAKNNTKQQIKDALGVSELPDIFIHQLIGEIFQDKNFQQNGQTLYIANGMFLQKDYNVSANFKEILTKNYHSDVQEVNFIQAQNASDQINHWVEERTNNLIKNLTNPDTIDGLTRLMLVNTVYFEAGWKNEFKMKEKLCTFTLEDHTQKQVACMTNTFQYRTKTDYRRQMEFVAIDYASTTNTTSYLIIGLPKTNSLSNFITNAQFLLKSMDVSKWEKKSVELTLPIFEMTQTLDVKNVLKSMGVTDVFDPLKSNLSGITKQEELHMSEFVHQAHINVNQHGTEAAAASAVQISSRSYGEKIKQFNVNRPFFYGIYSEETMMFTFVGKVGDPTAN